MLNSTTNRKIFRIFLFKKIGIPFVHPLLQELKRMNKKIWGLSLTELHNLISRERRKFLTAINYNSTASDLEEIRDNIRELEQIAALKQENADKDTAEGFER